MCSIMGFTRRSTALNRAKEAFLKTTSRGPDAMRFEEAGDGWLGFQRLAIMGLTEEGMQPFHLDGDMVVCNGELYGFRELRRELIEDGCMFRSSSDCENIPTPYLW